MNEKDVIALADMIREHNENAGGALSDVNVFDETQIEALADFCADQNPNFHRQRFLDYIAGNCGPWREGCEKVKKDLTFAKLKILSQFLPLDKLSVKQQNQKNYVRLKQDRIRYGGNC